MITEKAFLNQDFLVFLRFYEKTNKKNMFFIFKKSMFYLTGLGAAFILIGRGEKYASQIESIKKKEKKPCITKEVKKDKKINTDKEVNKVWSDIAQTCLFVLKDPDKAIFY